MKREKISSITFTFFIPRFVLLGQHYCWKENFISVQLE